MGGGCVSIADASFLFVIGQRRYGRAAVGVAGIERRLAELFMSCSRKLMTFNN